MRIAGFVGYITDPWNFLDYCPIMLVSTISIWAAVEGFTEDDTGDILTGAIMRDYI